MQVYEKTQHHFFRTDATLRIAALWTEVWLVSHPNVESTLKLYTATDGIQLKPDIIARVDVSGWIQKVWQRGIDQLLPSEQVQPFLIDEKTLIAGPRGIVHDVLFWLYKVPSEASLLSTANGAVIVAAKSQSSSRGAIPGRSHDGAGAHARCRRRLRRLLETARG